MANRDFHLSSEPAPIGYSTTSARLPKSHASQAKSSYFKGMFRDIHDRISLRCAQGFRRVRPPVTPSQDADQYQSPLFRLPPELRMQIYAEVLYDDRPRDIDMFHALFSHMDWEGVSPPPLLSACRSIYREANPIFVKLRPFPTLYIHPFPWSHHQRWRDFNRLAFNRNAKSLRLHLRGLRHLNINVKYDPWSSEPLEILFLLRWIRDVITSSPKPLRYLSIEVDNVCRTPRSETMPVFYDPYVRPEHSLVIFRMLSTFRCCQPVKTKFPQWLYHELENSFQIRLPESGEWGEHDGDRLENLANIYTSRLVTRQESTLSNLNSLDQLSWLYSITFHRSLEPVFSHAWTDLALSVY